MSELNKGAQGSGDSGAGNAGGASGGSPAGTPPPGGSGGAGAQGGANGASGGSWLDSLSPEFRENPNIKGYKSVDDLAKSYIHAQGMIGADKVIVPGKSSTDQDWEGVFAKLGRPESPDKYEFQLAEGHKAEDLKDFKEAAHKAGLLPRQVEALYKWNTDRAQAQQQEMATKRESMIKEGLEKLKQEWPDNKYEENLNKAAKAVVNVFGKEAFEWADKCGVGDDPMFLKMMVKLHDSMSEDAIKGQGDVSFNMGSADAEKKINSILGNPSHPYFDSTHAGHNDAVKEVEGLYLQMSRVTQK